jgi:hypothetical protein
MAQGVEISFPREKAVTKFAQPKAPLHQAQFRDAPPGSTIGKALGPIGKIAGAYVGIQGWKKLGEAVIKGDLGGIGDVLTGGITSFGKSGKDRSAERETALRLAYSTAMGESLKRLAPLGRQIQNRELLSSIMTLQGLRKSMAAGGDIAHILSEFNKITGKLGSREGIRGLGGGGGIGLRPSYPTHGVDAIAGGKSETPGGKSETPGGKSETPSGKFAIPGGKFAIPIPRGNGIQGKQFAGEIGSLGVGGGDTAPAVGYSAGAVGTTKTPMARGTVSARGSGEDINRLLGLLA